MKPELTLGFRDPHAFLREEVLGLGLEQEVDGPLLEKVYALTRRQALLVYHTIMMVRAGEEELGDEAIICLIENPREEAIVPGPTTLQ